MKPSWCCVSLSRVCNYNFKLWTLHNKKKLWLFAVFRARALSSFNLSLSWIFPFHVNFNLFFSPSMFCRHCAWYTLKRSLWKKNYYNSDAIIMRGEREWYVLHGCGRSSRRAIIVFLFTYIRASSPSDTIYTELIRIW